ASAKPPSESNVHDRMDLATGSQPMICMPDMLIWPSVATVNVRVMKLWFFVHLHSVSMSTLSSLSTQWPIIHSSGLSCSYRDGVASLSFSVTRSSSHCPSRLTKTALYSSSSGSAFGASVLEIPCSTATFGETNWIDCT